MTDHLEGRRSVWRERRGGGQVWAGEEGAPRGGGGQGGEGGGQRGEVVKWRGGHPIVLQSQYLVIYSYSQQFQTFKFLSSCDKPYHGGTIQLFI